MKGILWQIISIYSKVHVEKKKKNNGYGINHISVLFRFTCQEFYTSPAAIEILGIVR